MSQVLHCLNFVLFHEFRVDRLMNKSCSLYSIMIGNMVVNYDLRFAASFLFVTLLLLVILNREFLLNYTLTAPLTKVCCGI